MPGTASDEDLRLPEHQTPARAIRAWSGPLNRRDWGVAHIGATRSEVETLIGLTFEEIVEEGLGKYWNMRFNLPNHRNTGLLEIYATRSMEGVVLTMDAALATLERATAVVTLLGLSQFPVRYQSDLE